MSKIQKLLRIEEKLAKHCFRNMNLKSTWTPIIGYVCSAKAEKLKKSVHKDSRGQRVFAC